LKQGNPDGDDVIVLESSSEETEALAVVNEIRELVDKELFSHKDIAVLYRANFQSRYLEESFQQHKSRITFKTASASTIERRSRFCWIISE
jgi:DNA helicase-2/ATP-dependent DNA helicase PcrA